MFRKSFHTSLRLYKSKFLSVEKKIVKLNNLIPIRSYETTASNRIKLNTLQSQLWIASYKCKCQVHRHYSRGVLDGDISDLQNAQKERELTNISSLYPSPRVTLNEFAAKSPNHVFDIHYKQSVVAPKGSRKKTTQNDWTCTYSFVWPEKMKLEGTAISKRKAAEKAAILALHWLHTNKRIDSKGFPIFDRSVIDTMNSSIQEPFRASISEKSMERVEKIWDDYENEIKDIYDRTFNEAKHRLHSAPVAVIKDSTLDEEDDLSEDTSLSSEDTSELSAETHRLLNFGYQSITIYTSTETQTPIHPVYCKHVSEPSETALDRRKRQLDRTLRHYEEERTPLPIDAYSEEIASTVSEHPVTVIVGAAGCGKSTRAPLALLRDGRAAILVSGPRRVAAVGLARRVAAEIGEQVGGTVGYQVRLDSQPPRPPAGSVLYCTSGVLLRRLQTNPGLLGCTHVFVDEAHERDINTDISLLLLKRAVRINPLLRVVVMSATLDTDVFSRYFDSCPIIEVPGRTFPVETLYLDDITKKYNLELSNTLQNCNREFGKPLLVSCKEVVEVVKAVDKTEPEGAILVFLPGWADIKQAKLLLDQCFDENTHLILPVHSRLSTTDQARMFSKPLPGVRKIVLATNIAETSVTIPDVVYVIDTGCHKEKRMKEGTGTASLQAAWVSKAAAKQRTGRAGRVQPGFCYKLYTEEKENEFEPFITPEILRVPLEQTVLDCKMYAPDDKVENFLSQLPEPPSKKAIQFAVNDLIDLGALNSSEQLTRLGSLLSFPLHPRLSRGLLASTVVGNCVAATTALAHAENVEVFANAGDRKEEIREIKREFNSTSDHAALHCIQEDFEELQRKRSQEVTSWCQRRGLRRDRLNYVKAISNLYLEEIIKSPIVQPLPDVEELNRFSGIDEFTPIFLLCGANSLLITKPRVRTKGKLKTEVRLVTSKGERAHIGSESVNHNITRHRAAILAYFGGFHSTERRALVVHKTSRVSPQAVAILCQGDVIVGESSEETTVLNLPRHNVQIHVPTSQVDHILKAREMFANTFKYYVDRDPKSISFEENTTVSRFKVRLVKAIGRILVEAHREFEEKPMAVDEFS